MQPVARAGVEAAYLDSIYITWDGLETGKGPTGTAVRERAPMVVRDVETSPSMQAWREYLRQHRLASVVAIPMRLGQDLVGALTVYSHAADAFDVAEVEVLQAAADDLAHGLHRLTLEQHHLLRMRQLEVIRQLTDEMISQRHMPTLLRLICEKAADLLSSTGGGSTWPTTIGAGCAALSASASAGTTPTASWPSEKGWPGQWPWRELMIVPDYHAWQIGRRPSRATVPSRP